MVLVWTIFGAWRYKSQRHCPGSLENLTVLGNERVYTAEDGEDATRTDFGDGGWSLNPAM